MKYVAPEFEIIRFGEEDVLTYSLEDFLNDCNVVEDLSGEKIEETGEVCDGYYVCSDVAPINDVDQ